MKKSLFLSMLAIVMVTFVSMGLTSCGDDDDDAVSSSLVGTWYCYDEHEIVAFTESTMAVYYLKNSNGKWKFDGEPDVSTYTLNGNNITMNFDGESFTRKLDLHGNTFTLTGFDDEGKSRTYTYKRFDGTPQELVNYLNEK